jgi:hypothetical protein
MVQAMSSHPHPATTGPEQGRRGNGQFARGASGNPGGRPPGARNKAALAAEALLAGEAEALTRKAVELALSGDLIALRLCLERILPPVKERPLRVDLPLKRATDADTAMRAVLEALRTGELTASDLGALARLVEAFVAQVRMAEAERQSEGLFPSLGRL